MAKIPQVGFRPAALNGPDTHVLKSAIGKSGLFERAAGQTVYIGNDRKDFIIVREVASEDDVLGPRFEISLQRVNSQLQWEVLRDWSASYPRLKVAEVTFVQSTDGFFTLITKRDVVLVD